MFTVMGIDPGISYLGSAALTVNTKKPEPFTLVYADSFRGDLNDFMINNDTPNQTKAKGLLRAYDYLIDYLQPDTVCCEDNFLERSPSSFKRLIEVVTMMSYSTLKKENHIPFHLVLPRLAKQIINIDFRGSTKDDVREGLINCGLIDLNDFDLTKLTEHANDAILLSLYEAIQLYKSYGWIIRDDHSRLYHISS